MNVSRLSPLMVREAALYLTAQLSSGSSYPVAAAFHRTYFRRRVREANRASRP